MQAYPNIYFEQTVIQGCLETTLCILEARMSNYTQGLWHWLGDLTKQVQAICSSRQVARRKDEWSHWHLSRGYPFLKTYPYFEGINQSYLWDNQDKSESVTDPCSIWDEKGQLGQVTYPDSLQGSGFQMMGQIDSVNLLTQSICRPAAHVEALEARCHGAKSVN